MTDYTDILLGAFLIYAVYLVFKYRKKFDEESFNKSIIGGSVGIFTGWIVMQLISGLSVIDIISNIVKSTIIM